MSTKSPTEISKDELEKAAAVRLFEKVAAANGINLNKLDNSKLAELYTQFEAEVLPRIVAQDQQEKQAAAIHSKLASLTDQQIYALFEKQAAAEPDLVAGGGLDALTDEQLKLGFAHFIENVLPIMAAQDFAPVTPAQASKIAEVQEAQVKLAEAEALGRHMARAFYDEASKLAAAEKTASGTELAASSIGKRLAGMARASAKPLAAGAAGAAAGFAAGRASKGEKQANAVTLSPEDVTVLAKLAAAGDLNGLKSATAAIVKAAELPPQFQKKDEKGEDEKGEDEKGEEKKASALDLLVEERATALTRAYLIENGLLQE